MLNGLTKSTDHPSSSPHPVIVTIRDNKAYIKVLLYSYYTTITGWGVFLPCTLAAQLSIC